MVAGTSDAAPRLAPLRARDEKIQQLRRAVAIAILAGDRSTGGGRGDEPDGTRESRADPSDPRSLASFDESETRLSARACAPTRTRCDMQRGGKRTITDETKSTGTGEQSGVSYFVIRHSVPRDFSRDGPRASSLSHSPRRNNARDMSSPFHGGDVGSAIQSAKARGVPMLVALHGASHPAATRWTPPGVARTSRRRSRTRNVGSRSAWRIARARPARRIAPSSSSSPRVGCPQWWR